MTEDRPIEVTIKFCLPEHEEEFHTMLKAQDYHGILIEIYNRCRSVWKFEGDNITATREDLAREIGLLAGEVWEE